MTVSRLSAELNTDLQAAVKAGDAKLAAALLEQGADVNASNAIGAAPIHEASWSGNVGTPRTADFPRRRRQRPPRRRRIDSLALRGHHRSPGRRPAPAEVAAPTYRPSTVQARQLCISPPISTIARSWNYCWPKARLVNAKDKGGYTPLCDAVRKGRVEIVKILLDHGATVNTRANETGFTPLHLAAAAGDANVIRMLLAKSADRTVRDVFGATPLEHAVHLNQTLSVEALLPPGAASQLADLLSEAVVKGNAGMVAVLLDRGADVNARNKSASTPLHDAALKDRAEVAKVLLQHGADVRARNGYGGSPLHDAALAGATDVAELLLANKAEIDASDDSGATPLYQAAAWGRLEAVKLLLQKGAAGALPNKEGVTPRQAAIANGHKAVADLLF